MIFNLLDCAFKTLCEASLFIFNKPLGVLESGRSFILLDCASKHSVRQVCLSFITLSVFWMVFQPA